MAKKENRGKVVKAKNKWNSKGKKVIESFESFLQISKPTIMNKTSEKEAYYGSNWGCDEVSPMCKLLITSNTIVWMAQRLNEVNAQIQMMINVNVNREDLPQEQKQRSVNLFNKNEDAIKRAFVGLRKVAEELGNFVDGCDVIDKIDTEVTTPAFDIMYNRVEEKS